MQNKAQVGGVLTVISGAFGIIEALIMIAMVLFMNSFASSPEFGVGADESDPFGIFMLVYGIIGFVLLLVGTTSLVGGIYALKKRLWGLTLAGAICGIISFLPLGIIATIFIAQSQNEFPSSTPVASVPVPEP